MRINQISVVLLPAIALLAGCSGSPAGSKAAAKGGFPPAPVRVATAVRQDVPLEVSAIGNVEAYSSVAVKSRVAGQLEKVHIRDGQEVHAGDLLFEIDRAPFEEQLRMAEANLARDVAMEKQALANIARNDAEARTARAQANRYAALQKEGVIAQEQAEQMRTTAEAAEASLAADRAALESARASIKADESRVADAKLQLGYTTIRAPISGRTGAVAIKEGNLVKENDTQALVIILRAIPVYVTFSVPEQVLPEIRRQMASGGVAVKAWSDESADSPATGKLEFIDNTVDSTTGTIRMKAVFPNEDRKMWPGEFVNVNVRLSIQKDAVVAPTASVQTGLDGKFIWVVKGDGSAEVRKVVVARTHGDVSVISSGLEAGERVVTEGQMKLAPGARVEILGAPGGAKGEGT